MKKIYVVGASVSLLIMILSKQERVKSETKSKLVQLYWFQGITYTGRYDTRMDELIYSGCPDMGTAHCVDGYDANDFNVVSDPYSGLKTGATINDFIRHP